MSEYRLPTISAEDALRARDAGAILLDIRKPAAREASATALAGAETRDPYRFGHDDPLTRVEEPVIVFCVHGHEVSRFACALMLLHGRDARLVAGGFEALVAAGAPLVALEPEQ